MERINLKIIRALAKVANRDQNVRESGNIKSLVLQIGEGACEDIADMVFDTPVASNEIREIVMKSILLGRLARNRIIMRVVFPNKHMYFIGTEADVVRKLRTLLPEDQEEKKENKEDSGEKSKK
jgi:hypothetical protein